VSVSGESDSNESPRVVSLRSSGGCALARDRYRRFAKIYDSFFESMNSGFVVRAMEIHPPTHDMRVLDVGCGTGSWLVSYQEANCQVCGIDSSRSMAGVARQKVAGSGGVVVGDAVAIPFVDGSFDLVIASLLLHELEPEDRSAVVEEMKRVLKPDGRMLLADFASGRVRGFRGHFTKFVAVLVEAAAGFRHFRCGRRFVRQGGMRALGVEKGLELHAHRILGRGNFEIGVFSLDQRSRERLG